MDGNGNETVCDARPDDGGETHHCFHPATLTSDVCCWCGDLFLGENCDVTEHGEYLPEAPDPTKEVDL